MANKFNYHKIADLLLGMMHRNNGPVVPKADIILLLKQSEHDILNKKLDDLEAEALEKFRKLSKK